MDKYEYNLKLDEIKKLVSGGSYEAAAKVADTIEWKRVRNIRTLCMVSEIYEANGRLEDSKEILLKAYRRSQMTRTVLFRLTEVAIKMKEFDDAVEYYSEFVNLAPNDTSRYILKYEIYKGRGSSLEDQIAILEEYKEIEYTEQWGYELAKLYYQAGNKEKCVENCDDLVLWFRQGRYVIKALELKKSIMPLTAVQQSIYDHKEENLTLVEERVEAAVPELEKIIVDKVPATKTEAITDNIISQTQKELAEAVSQHAAETDHSIPDNTWRYTPTSMGATKTVPVKEVREILNGSRDGQTDAYAGAMETAAAEQGMAGNQGVPSMEPGNQGAANMSGIPDGAMAGGYAGETQDGPDMAEMPGVQSNPGMADSQMGQNVQNVPDGAGGQAAQRSRQAEYDPIQLQQELANSMREIISGITRTSSEGEIIEPKNDMSAFQNSSEKLPTPELEREGSIDDILLSMSGIDPQSVKEKHIGNGVSQKIEESPAAEKMPGGGTGADQNQEGTQPQGMARQNGNKQNAGIGQEGMPVQGTVSQNGTAQNAGAVQGQGGKPVQGTTSPNGNVQNAGAFQMSQGGMQPQGTASQNGNMQNTGMTQPSQGTGQMGQISQGAVQSQGGMQPQGGVSQNGSAQNAGTGQMPQGVYQRRTSGRNKTQNGASAQGAASGQRQNTLTVSQQYQFSYFATIQGMPEQIASALQDSLEKVSKDRTSRSGNLVITGGPGSGKTNLAIRFAKTVSLERGIASARIAKIYAEDFNKKDIPATIAKIAGGTLIIEEAGDLEEEVVEQLSKAMEFRTDGLLVILEDEPNYLKTLFDSHPGFAEKFTSEIHIPIMTNDELVSFGRMYAYEEDYRIDDMAMMALYNRISELQSPDHPVTIADVKDIVDEAVHRSERAGIRKLGMILSRKRYDEDDRIILYEKDFK